MGLIWIPYRLFTSPILECNSISCGLPLLPLVLAAKATFIEFFVTAENAACNPEQTDDDSNDANGKKPFIHVLVSICRVRNEMPLWLVVEC